MRIVGGRFKGRALVAPKGRTTRPTAERAREAVFIIVAHADWAPPLVGARVIDGFAGSGALGFEALSRGAAFCLFVETDTAARGAIRATVESLGLYGATRIHRRSAVDLGAKPAGLGAGFTLALLDPPYGRDLAPKTAALLASGGWLAADALLVWESSVEENQTLDGWSLRDERDYGAARFGFWRRVEQA
ncbi:MAG: 16S rRNA (guanine(966)-N(2))-methyltransferase RsmD [Maricaulaceae bacterium]